MRVLLIRSGDRLADEVTGSDGRIAGLGGELAAGAYTLVFETGAYFGGADHLYERVAFDLTIPAGAGHHHVPLLLAPFAVSSYRGS